MTTRLNLATSNVLPFPSLAPRSSADTSNGSMMTSGETAHQHPAPRLPARCWYHDEAMAAPAAPSPRPTSQLVDLAAVRNDNIVRKTR